MHFRSRISWLAGVAIAVCLATTAQRAQASSVTPMTLPEMADHAATVILADVASREPAEAQRPWRIETTIKFVHVRYLKGEPPAGQDGESFSLVVPGGTIGDRTMRVCCAPKFTEGQKRIVFILPSYTVYPVVGLWQGTFTIKTDDQGIERVYDAAGWPVTGIASDGAVESAQPHHRRIHGHAGGTVQSHLIAAHGGVSVVSVIGTEPQVPIAAKSAQAAMTLDAFIAELAPILKKSRRHDLSHPAGQRRPMPKQAVPLIAAPSATSGDHADAHHGTRTSDIAHLHVPLVPYHNTPRYKATALDDVQQPNENKPASHETDKPKPEEPKPSDHADETGAKS